MTDAEKDGHMLDVCKHLKAASESAVLGGVEWDWFLDAALKQFSDSSPNVTIRLTTDERQAPGFIHKRIQATRRRKQ